ncbi:tumor necrosis factor-inducible gene 6 protein isoform X1 [Stigmatopora argus]
MRHILHPSHPASICKHFLKLMPGTSCLLLIPDTAFSMKTSKCGYKRSQTGDLRPFPVLPLLNSIPLVHTLPTPVHPGYYAPPIQTAFTAVSKHMPTIIQRDKAEELIRSMGEPDLQIFTDGSTKEGTADGGAGFVVIKETAIIHQWHGATEALSWLRETADWQTSIILSDCKSLVQAMGNPHTQDPTIRRLQGDIALFPPPKRLQLLWIPGHCNICGNDLADALAKLGSLDDQTHTPPDAATRRAIIQREDRSPPLPPPPFADLHYKSHRGRTCPIERRPHRPDSFPQWTPPPAPPLAPPCGEIRLGWLPPVRRGNRVV